MFGLAKANRVGGVSSHWGPSLDVHSAYMSSPDGDDILFRLSSVGQFLFTCGSDFCKVLVVGSNAWVCLLGQTQQFLSVCWSKKGERLDTPMELVHTLCLDVGRPGLHLLSSEM